MKIKHDINTKKRNFKSGDKLLIFLLVLPYKQNISVSFNRPGINDLNYVVRTPDQRNNKRIYHVNMIKYFIERNNNLSMKQISTLIS